MRMRSILVIIMIMGVLLSATGCSQNTLSVDLAICGSFGVPGMLCTDLKGGAYECVILDEDTQGRILYEYITQSIITGKEERAAVICQKRDSDTVYYYEDECYLINEWTNDELVLLKEQNDWDQPLDHAKMASKSNKTTFDGFIATCGDFEYKKVEQACCDKLGIEQQQIEDLCFLDTDGSQIELYWLVIDRYSNEECYFVMVDKDYHILILHAERTLFALTELEEFKQNGGWGQGNNSVVSQDKP